MKVLVIRRLQGDLVWHVEKGQVATSSHLMWWVATIMEQKHAREGLFAIDMRMRIDGSTY